MGKTVHFFQTLLYTFLAAMILNECYRVINSCICLKGFDQNIPLYIDHEYDWEIDTAIMGCTNVIASVGVILALKKNDKNYYIIKKYKIFIHCILTIEWFIVLALTIIKMVNKIKRNHFHELLFYSSIISIISTTIIMIICFAFMLKKKSFNCINKQ